MPHRFLAIQGQKESPQPSASFQVLHQAPDLGSRLSVAQPAAPSPPSAAASNRPHSVSGVAAKTSSSELLLSVHIGCLCPSTYPASPSGFSVAAETTSESLVRAKLLQNPARISLLKVHLFMTAFNNYFSTYSTSVLGTRDIRDTAMNKGDQKKASPALRNLYPRVCGRDRS